MSSKHLHMLPTMTDQSKQMQECMLPHPKKNTRKITSEVGSERVSTLSKQGVLHPTRRTCQREALRCSRWAKGAQKLVTSCHRCVRTCTDARMRDCMPTHICSHTYMWMCAHEYIYMCMCAHVRIHACVNTCVHTQYSSTPPARHASC